MKVNYTILIFIAFIYTKNFAQVGLGTITPAATLDITAANGGVLVPRVALTSKNVSAPVVNPQGGALVSGTLVWNTSTTGTIPDNVIPGFYYWDTPTLKWVALSGTNSNNWTLNGNTGVNGGNTTTAGTNYIGTTDNQNLDIHTNNTYVARFSSLGEFFLGTLNTTLTGDLMNSVGNTTFPWAVNGYTAFAGGSVYGLRKAGSTGVWGAVQGELDPTIAAGSPGVNGTVTVSSQYGVRGYKPSGGLGYGGVFFNDLGYSGGLYTVSDRRLKKNIQPLQNVLETIKSIPFYTYNFKTEDYDMLGGDEIHYGVMSDELKSVIPSLVKAKIFNAGQIRSQKDGKQPRSVPFEINAVNYMELIPIALEGIKEQQKLIEDQNARIARLEKIILELQNQK